MPRPVSHPQVPLVVFSLMPSNMGAYFIKHNLQLEDGIGEYNQV